MKLIINTQFDLKETVFFMQDNKVCTGKIEEIKTRTDDNGVTHSITYVVRTTHGGDLKEFVERLAQLYPTRESLLNSI